MAAAAVERPGAPPPPKQRYQGVQKESAGYRLLTAMGWREGEGLGASKQGIKSHIKVKKKFENWGVGALEAAEHAQNWTNGMLDFHRVLSNLSEVVSEHAKRRSDPSSSGSGSDSDTGSDASGGKGGAAASSGSSSSSSDDEEQEQQRKGRKRGGEAEPAATPPKRVKAATHTGRYKKREAAKMVKGYSEHDLAAILGGDPFAAAAAAVPEIKAQPQRQASSSGYDSDGETSDSDEDSGPAKQQQQQLGKAQAPAGPDSDQPAQPERPPMIVVRRPMPAACRPPQPPTPQEARRPGWWQVCFHKAQGPKGVGAAAAAGTSAGITVHGFSEQDQTNLYNLAHDKATQGRVGLGRSSMPKKVAGARWQGTKTLIQDSDDEGGSQLSADDAAPQFRRQEGVEEGPAPAGVELEKEEGLVIIVPASKRHLLDALPGYGAAQQTAAAQPAAQQEQQQAEDAAPAGKASKKAKKAKKAAAAAEQQQQQQQAAAEGGLGRIKWKKAVAAALQAGGKSKMKLSKLHKAVVKEHGVAKAQRAAALEALTAFLRQSSKFTLADGVVRGAAS